MEIAASLNRLDRRGIAALALGLMLAAAASTCAHHRAAWDASGATARVSRPIASEFSNTVTLRLGDETMTVTTIPMTALTASYVPSAGWRPSDRRPLLLAARAEADAPVSSEKFAAASMLALIVQDR